jgi:1-phosphofructokinase
MIYTVTLNPSLDYYMYYDEIALGTLNRSKGEDIIAGGKGINVSLMLKRLGLDSCALVAAGGFVGDEIIRSLSESGIETVRISTEGNTRINVKLSESHTELNGLGAVATERTKDELNSAIASITRGDIAVLSGSVCRGFESVVYRDIVSELKARGVITVVDASGELFKNAVESAPFLMKPNHIELGEMFGVKIEDKQSAMYYARRLADMGVSNVIVSMGEAGALLATADKEYYVKAPKLKAVNTVGAGDCLVAGFIYALAEGRDKREALAYAVACGSARAALGEFPDKSYHKQIFDKLLY